MKKKVIVAAHKPYNMPQDPMYLPLQVGAKDKPSLGWQRDDDGVQISEKNPYYCELTGLYWAWKNLDCDALGLVHYRRYFKGSAGPFGILSDQEANKLLEKYDCILPKKQRYVIETIQSHYEHTHYGEDLQACREVIAQHFPSYLEDFDKQMNRRSSHMFNMFIMKKPLADAYARFVFSVLDLLEKRIDISKYDPFQARVFGRIAEILLDVWIEHNHISYVEVPLVYTEKIDWVKKCTAFLKAKFFHERYKGSF